VCLTFWFSCICSVGCILLQRLCTVKKLKQEVLLDQCCLHLAKWSISFFHSLATISLNRGSVACSNPHPKPKQQRLLIHPLWHFSKKPISNCITEAQYCWGLHRVHETRAQRTSKVLYFVFALGKNSKCTHLPPDRSLLTFRCLTPFPLRLHISWN